MCCRVISARGGRLCQNSTTSPEAPGTEQQKRTTYVLQNRTVLFATNTLRRIRCDGFVPMSTDGRVSEDAIAVHTVDYGQMTVPPSETTS